MCLSPSLSFFFQLKKKINIFTLHIWHQLMPLTRFVLIISQSRLSLHVLVYVSLDWVPLKKTAPSIYPYRFIQFKTFFIGYDKLLRGLSHVISECSKTSNAHGMCCKLFTNWQKQLYKQYHCFGTELSWCYILKQKRQLKHWNPMSFSDSPPLF